MESLSPKQQFSPTKTPLFPASPERMNQQRLAGSTSMPLDLNQKSCDVREKIAFLNNLSRAGSPAASPVHATSSNVSSSSAALQRAILGREEAESALTNANNLLKDAQARERRISERLESLLEELQTTRERQAHERAVFEKEVRKARKEAFRAGSMLVKVQEELKLAKGEMKTLKEEVRAEKESKERAKQEAFERAYALAGITEEAQLLKDQLRALESNNQQNILESRVDGLNESISRSSVEYTDQATYTTPSPRRPKRSVDALELLKDIQSNEEQNAQSEGTPTKKLRLSSRVSDVKDTQPDSLEYHFGIIADLRAEIQLEQRRRAKAEDMVFFMKMECQFKRCSCRIAENLGQKYIHDKEWAEHHQEENSEQEEDEIPEEAKPETLEQDVREQTPSTSAAHSPLISPVTAMTPPTPHYQELNDEHKAERPARHSSVAYCRESGTFIQVSSPHAYMHDRPSEGPLVLPNADEEDDSEFEDDVAESSENLVERANAMEEHAEIITITSQYPPNELCIETEKPEPKPTNTFTRNHKLPPHPSYERVPITPVEQTTAINKEHITKTVPIRIESRHSRNPADIIPGTPLTREEALAQIRARRGRTKSGTQRSVSANEATARAGAGPTTTGGPARRIPGVKSSETRSETDVKERRGTAPVVSRRY